MDVRPNDPWIAHLNGPRLRAVFALADDGNFTAHIMSAVRDQRWSHAAELIRQLDWSRIHKADAMRLARQIETGDDQTPPEEP